MNLPTFQAGQMPYYAPSALHGAAMADLRAFFDARAHRPSEDHWDALGDIVTTMDLMAAGECPALVHVGALDPGVGKSSAVLSFARALMASGAHKGVGMVVCVGRIEEAKTMAAALLGSNPGAPLAVLTSKDDANAMSTCEPDAAQVLITTQQRIERATERATFAEAAAFHFHGAPRHVRVWDEAWLPGEAVTITGDELLFLVKPFRSRSDAGATALLTFIVGLTGLADGALVQVPDFEADHGISLVEVTMDIVGGDGRPRDDQHAAARALRVMAGKAARLKNEGGKNGGTMLTYKDTLPADLTPLLVLDASARVRRTYAFIERDRGGLVMLRPAVKDYGPLTVNVWDTSGSKSGWEKNGKDLVEGIVETILERPGDRWLVVHHKATGRAQGHDGAIRRKLPRDVAGRVEFITWGNHMASNAYAEVPNVILAGTLFMRPSHYVATTHLVQDRDVALGMAPADDVRSVTVGEHSNLILQALCRGRVRKSNGAKCLPMNAYVIASPKSGIRDAVVDIFPGCKVRPWRVTQDQRLPRTLTKAIKVIESSMAEGVIEVPFRTISDRLGVDPKNLPKLVTKQPQWPTELQRHGWVTYGGRGKPGGVRPVQ